MIRDDQRFCDICNDLIPKGKRYRVTEMTPEAAQIFLELSPLNPDMLPNWTQNEDGLVLIDICMQCHKGMSGRERD